MQAASSSSAIGSSTPSLLRPCSTCRTCSRHSPWFTAVRRAPMRRAAVCGAVLPETGHVAEQSRHASSGVSSVLRHVPRMPLSLSHALNCFVDPHQFANRASHCMWWQQYCICSLTPQRLATSAGRVTNHTMSWGTQAACCSGTQRLSEHGRACATGAGACGGLFPHGGAEEQRLRQVQDEVSGAWRFALGYILSRLI